MSHRSKRVLNWLSLRVLALVWIAVVSMPFVVPKVVVFYADQGRTPTRAEGIVISISNWLGGYAYRGQIVPGLFILGPYLLLLTALVVWWRLRSRRDTATLSASPPVVPRGHAS